MSNSLINRGSRRIQIVFVAGILAGLHEELTSEIGTPGKSSTDSFKAALKDLSTMLQDPKFGSKARRAQLAQVIAALAQAIAASETAPSSAFRPFSDANYTSIFGTVQALVAYAVKNGISLVEENPIALMVRNLNAVLANAVDCANQGWYEQVLVATHAMLADVQQWATASRRDAIRSTAITYVGFEPMKAAETETRFQTASAPADKVLVATSGESIDQESQQEDYANAGFNAGKGK